MQVIVLVVQNSVPAEQIGTATSTNNYFREVGASLGVAVFGSIFTSRLAESLTKAFTGAGASADQASQSTKTLDPKALSQLPEQLKDAIVNAYADSLAPVFWYLLSFLGIALILALTLKQIPLSDTAGMVARGEAVGGEEAERLEAERQAKARRTAVAESVATPEGAGVAIPGAAAADAATDAVKNDDGGLANHPR